MKPNEKAEKNVQDMLKMKPTPKRKPRMIIPKLSKSDSKANTDILFTDEDELLKFTRRTTSLNRRRQDVNFDYGAEDFPTAQFQGQLSYGATFFDDFVPRNRGQDAAETVNEKKKATTGRLENIASGQNTRKTPIIVWDKQLNLLLCSLIVVVGIDPAKMKKKCPVLAEITDAKMLTQIEKILQQKCGLSFEGIKLDPYRMASYNRAELILMANLMPEWVCEQTGLLLLYPYLAEKPSPIPKSAKDKYASARKKAIENRKELIQRRFLPSENLIAASTQHIQKYNQLVADRIKRTPLQTTTSDTSMDSSGQPRQQQSLLQKCNQFHMLFAHFHRYRQLTAVFGRTGRICELPDQDEQEVVNKQFAQMFIDIRPTVQEQMLNSVSPYVKSKLTQQDYQTLVEFDDCIDQQTGREVRRQLEAQKHRPVHELGLFEGAFDWTKGAHGFALYLKPKTRKWLSTLNEGQKFLVFLFYQCAPVQQIQIQDEKRYQREPQKYDFLLEQTVPDMSECFDQLDKREKQQYLDFSNDLKGRQEFHKYKPSRRFPVYDSFKKEVGLVYKRKQLDQESESSKDSKANDATMEETFNAKPVQDNQVHVGDAIEMSYVEPALNHHDNNEQPTDTTDKNTPLREQKVPEKLILENDGNDDWETGSQK